ncbi:MAG: serine hydrolase domain-containing protein [Saprospiraceae bacterium]
MRTFFLLIFGLLILPLALCQNTSWQFQPKLDSLLSKKSVGAYAPGFAVCIQENGKIVYEHQSGLANLKLQKPITTETIFNIGSVTKQFTAACVLLLEEQGKLRRSDPIQKYIPELPDFGQVITLDHLIGHTSGLHSHLDVLNLRVKYKNSRLSPASIFSFYQQSPVLAFAPGTDFAYNNTAYSILCMVIERVSGMKTGDFMQKHIFQPLGMQHATFCLIEGDALTDGTVSYSYKAGKKRYKKDNSTHNMLGATGVHCSLRDLALWQNNFDHNRLGKGDPDLIRKMETTYHLNDGTPTHYGAGLLLKDYRGIPTIEHGGGWNSFLLQCRRFPLQGISVLVASNNDHSSPFPLADDICDILLTFKPLPEKASSDLNLLSVPSANLEGKYLSFNNRLRHVRRDADTLKISIDESSKKREISFRFNPNLSSDTLLSFYDPITGFPLQFIMAENGRVKGFFWEGGEYFQCRRFFEKLDETPVSTKNWAGMYSAKDFEQKVRVRRKGKAALKLKPVLFISYSLKPITGSVFKIPGDRVIVRFSEKGFVLGHDYVSNLTFSKR